MKNVHLWRSEYDECIKRYICTQISYHNENGDAVFIAKETVNMRKMRCTSDKDAGTLRIHIIRRNRPKLLY